MTIKDRSITEAAAVLARSTRAVASTGAGVSAESGIDTFRDVGGIWERLDPAEVGTVEGLVSALMRDAKKLMPMFFGLLNTFEKAEPNPGHRALADLEAMGIVQTVITQNADNLHQEAGSKDVIEVHGNAFRMRCLSCGRKKTFDRKSLARDVKNKLASFTSFSLMELASLSPPCPWCGSLTRPDVVMFGEAVHDLDRAFPACRSCDVMLVLGTSGVVYPAAGLPLEAKKAGGRVIVINPAENPFSQISDIYIPAKTGEALPAIVAAIREAAS